MYRERSLLFRSVFVRSRVRSRPASATFSKVVLGKASPIPSAVTVTFPSRRLDREKSDGREITGAGGTCCNRVLAVTFDTSQQVPTVRYAPSATNGGVASCRPSSCNSRYTERNCAEPADPRDHVRYVCPIILTCGPFAILPAPRPCSPIVLRTKATGRYAAPRPVTVCWSRACCRRWARTGRECLAFAAMNFRRRAVNIWLVPRTVSVRRSSKDRLYETCVLVELNRK